MRGRCTRGCCLCSSEELPLLPRSQGHMVPVGIGCPPHPGLSWALCPLGPSFPGPGRAHGPGRESIKTQAHTLGLLPFYRIPAQGCWASYSSFLSLTFLIKKQKYLLPGVEDQVEKNCERRAQPILSKQRTLNTGTCAFCFQMCSCRPRTEAHLTTRKQCYPSHLLAQPGRGADSDL